ncbi:MAG TPA: helix-turn-helix domain-containing protein, partial [Planctomycetes bacterium]|nr:helix-turn-helix domain-containing protein [Planctomycetota bacterium]
MPRPRTTCTPGGPDRSGQSAPPSCGGRDPSRFLCDSDADTAHDTAAGPAAWLSEPSFALWPVSLPGSQRPGCFEALASAAFRTPQPFRRPVKRPCAIGHQDWDCSKSGKSAQWELPQIARTPNTRFTGESPMDDIVLRIPRKDRQRMEKRCGKCKDANLRTRYLIILNLAEGRSVADTARALKVNRSTVYRVAARFREGG